jgi:hypothetical protein
MKPDNLKDIDPTLWYVQKIVEEATLNLITRPQSVIRGSSVPVKCVKCGVPWASILGGCRCSGSPEGHVTKPIHTWNEEHSWVAPGFVEKVVCTVTYNTMPKPEACECGSGCNTRGPGHAHYCRLLET